MNKQTQINKSNLEKLHLVDHNNIE